MSFQEEVKQGEERLRRGFKESLDRYYQWEASSQEEFLDSLYYPEDEEED